MGFCPYSRGLNQGASIARGKIICEPASCLHLCFIQAHVDLRQLREDYNELVGAATVRAVSYCTYLNVFVGMFIATQKGNEQSPTQPQARAVCNLQQP